LFVRPKRGSQFRLANPATEKPRQSQTLNPFYELSAFLSLLLHLPFFDVNLRWR
jgi:hypothetical protein